MLFGFDDEPNIVSIERMRDRSLVEIFSRRGNEVTSRKVKAPLFAYVNSKERALRSIKDDTTHIQELLGHHYYDRLVTSNNPKLIYGLKYNVDRMNMPQLHQQYFISSGKTLFKNMTFSDQRVLCFDIETITTPGFDFPNALRDGDKIVIIAMYDNKGWFRVLHGLDYEEPEMLEEFIRLIQHRDPDVLIGHNVFNFDLPYVETRCEKYGIEFAIGRNGSEPYKYDTSMKLADRDRAYTNYQVYGRHVLDTELLARQADVVKRKYENYQLKYLAKVLGIATGARTYVEGSKISETWHNDPYELIAYALDDVIETMGLYQNFGQSAFYSTQFVPMGYQDVFRLGAGGKIDNIFMRYYMNNWYSIPHPENKRHIVGGYADVFKYGYFDEPLVYADVASLYPSLATYLKIQPKSDTLKLYSDLVLLLKSMRYEVKALAKETGLDMYKSQDGAFKILLNTLSYGYLSWDRGSFNDYDEAERITEGGQEILKTMIETTKSWGGTPIKCDTDGMLTTVPKGFDSADEYCETLSEVFDEMIAIDNDGEYEKAIIIDKKSYALKVAGSDTPTIKGQTVRGRSIEPFGRDFIVKAVNLIMNNEPEIVKELYNEIKLRIENRKMEINEISVRGNIKEDLTDYQARVQLGSSNGGRNPDAPYELALKSDKDYDIGDVIVYYVKTPPMDYYPFRGKKAFKPLKLAKYESVEFAENYDYDYDINFYIERLDSCLKKFLPVLGPDFIQELNVKLNAKDKEKIERYGK